MPGRRRCRWVAPASYPWKPPAHDTLKNLGFTLRNSSIARSIVLKDDEKRLHQDQKPRRARLVESERGRRQPELKWSDLHRATGILGRNGRQLPGNRSPEFHAPLMELDGRHHPPQRDRKPPRETPSDFARLDLLPLLRRRHGRPIGAERRREECQGDDGSGLSHGLAEQGNLTCLTIKRQGGGKVRWRFAGEVSWGGGRRGIGGQGIEDNLNRCPQDRHVLHRRAIHPVPVDAVISMTFSYDQRLSLDD